VYDNALVSGDALVYGNALVYGDAQVYGDAKVYGNAWKTSPLYVQGTKHAATNCKYGWLAIGCQVRTFDGWLENVEMIAREHDYTEAEVAEYRAIVNFMTKVGK
jgi:hypothetical protein